MYLGMIKAVGYIGYQNNRNMFFRGRSYLESSKKYAVKKLKRRAI